MFNCGEFNKQTFTRQRPLRYRMVEKTFVKNVRSKSEKILILYRYIRIVVSNLTCKVFSILKRKIITTFSSKVNIRSVKIIKKKAENIISCVLYKVNRNLKLKKRVFTHISKVKRYTFKRFKRTSVITSKKIASILYVRFRTYLANVYLYFKERILKVAQKERGTMEPIVWIRKRGRVVISEREISFSKKDRITILRLESDKKLATIGDTIKLGVEFRTFAGILEDPTNIELNIYDDQRNVLENIVIDPILHRISTGIYECDYTVPDVKGDLIFEFSAILENTTVKKRERITKEWVDGYSSY